MAREAKLSHTAALILQAINAGFVYGFSMMEMTGLPSGTVYPAMRRLERDELIRSQWEKQSIADAEQRPPRKYYKLTATGKTTLEALATLSTAGAADSFRGGEAGMNRYAAWVCSTIEGNIIWCDVAIGAGTTTRRMAAGVAR